MDKKIIKFDDFIIKFRDLIILTNFIKIKALFR